MFPDTFGWDAIKDAIPVTEEEAFGDGWKKLPYGSGRKSKALKSKNPSKVRAKSVEVTKEKVFYNPSKKGKSEFHQSVKIGEVRLEVPGKAGATYTKDLINLVKNYIQRHPALF